MNIFKIWIAILCGLYGTTQLKAMKTPQLKAVKMPGEGSDLYNAVSSKNIDRVEEALKVLENEHDRRTINKPSGPGSLTPLQRAVKDSSKEIAEKLLEKGADINARGGYGDTALHTAAREHNVVMAKFLFGKGAEANARNKQKETPLHYAADNGPLDLVKLLIENRDVNKNAKDLEGKTPMFRAAEHGHAEILKKFADMDDADPNVQDSIGDTMLHVAAKLNYPDVVRILFDPNAKKKPDVNLINREKETPLDIAIDSKREDIKKLLIAHGAMRARELQ